MQYNNYPNNYNSYSSNYDGERIEYKLLRVDFNKINRKTNVVLNQINFYKTIVKYVQRNYQKQPVYSNWKTKEKLINKKVLLNGSGLENLINNDDSVIREKAFEILEYINSNYGEKLEPSWYKKSLLVKEMREKLDEESKKWDGVLSGFDNEKGRLESAISVVQNLLVGYKKSLEKNKKCSLKIKRNLERNGFVKGLAGVFTFGGWFKLNNQKRLDKVNLEIRDLEKAIEINNNDLNEKRNILNEIVKTIENKKIEKENEINKIKRYYQNEILLLVPLTDKVNLDEEGFGLLKDYYSDEKLNEIKVGCYVIRNNVNGKIYVGQSKNIPHRIRTHFDGLVPKNNIFFEDYYKDKDNEELFSIKIIPGNIFKLDLQEMELIDKYNAYEVGYNRTIGNETTLKRLKERMKSLKNNHNEN